MQYNRPPEQYPNNGNSGYSNYAPPTAAANTFTSSLSKPPSYGMPPPDPPGSAPASTYGSRSGTVSFGYYGAQPAIPAAPAPPVVTGPPISGQVSQSAYVGNPPSYAAPASNYPAPSQPTSRPAVQFFSVAGGTPIPSSSASTVSGPPPSTAGPQSYSMASSQGPPIGGPGIQPAVGGPPLGGAGFAPPPPVVGPPPVGPPGSDSSQYSPSTAGSASSFEGGQGGSYAHQASLDNLTPSSLPLLSEVDLSLVCSKEFMRPTVGKIVSSQALATASRVPIGIIICPMAGDKGTANEQVPVVDFGATGIVRCKRCRTYINPFVVWLDAGRKWKCNICGLGNETPSSYFSHLDEKNRRHDRDQRPELSSCSVEFVAPNDYQIRPPQPPTYLFLIDASPQALLTGMLPSAVNAIKTVLSELPGNPRTQVGILTYDTTIHFYSLKASLSSPQMLVISDLSDIILPLPEDLVANLQDSRKVVESLLDSLPSMFPASQAAANQASMQGAITPTQVASCLGSALAVAKHILEPTGGKVVLLQTVLPSYGDGALKQRDNPRLLGTDKEHTLLNSEDTFYRNMALDFNKLQIAADVFLFASTYVDIATLGQLAKYTGGQLFYYPAYYALRDEKVFQVDLQRVLTRATAFEAVMRVRATRGLRITNFYGNYFIRGTDLLALPNCTSDSCFAVDIAYDEPVLQAQVICIQAALLYTSSAGERKIRVHNLILPISATSSEMMESCDMDAMMNLLSKQAIEVALKAGLDTARTRIHQTAIDILKSLRSPVPSVGHAYGHTPGLATQPQGELLVPIALQLLPLYAMALQKSVLLRGGSDVRPDERASYFQRIMNADVSITKTFIYPRLFSIHDAGTDVGLPTDVNLLEETNPNDAILTAGSLRIRLPTLLNLSAERLLSDGVYLLENSMELLLWVGKHVPPVTLLSLFGMATFDGIDMSTVMIQPDASEYAQRIQAVILALQSERIRAMQVHVIREGDGYAEAYFSRFLIEDRANFQGGALSYTEYYGVVLHSV